MSTRADSRLEKQADLSLLPPGGRVIVGFSGGADSMALTHYTAGQVDRERIHCVHINHMLRAGEAERDEAACKTFCKERGLRFIVFREDVRAYAKENKLSEEAAGRELRYRRFQLLVTSEDDRILTAHNADDNAETVLLNIARGSGLSGLCGIPIQRENILRPLLRVSREDIEGYCRQYGLTFVQDSTNDTDDYARNRIRRAVIPVLKELNPAFLQAATGLTERLKRDRDYILLQVDELLESVKTDQGLCIGPLRRAHESIRTAALKRYFDQQGCPELTARHVDYAAGHLRNGCRMTLPGGLVMECSADILRVTKKTVHEAWQIPTGLGKTALPNGKCLTLSKIPEGIYRRESKINKLLFKSVLDCDTINHRLIVRSRRPGDRFAPAGRGITKTMKQLLLEAGIPAGLRDDVVLLEMNGQVIFVEGIGAAESFQVTDKTSSVLQIQV